MNLDRTTASLYFLLVPLALAFWVGWSYRFGVWNDVGLYAVLVVMLGFGFLGSYVYGRARQS